MFARRVLLSTPVRSHLNYGRTMRCFSDKSQWIVQGTQENFDDLVQNPNPVIIDVMAQWCPPCKQLGPILEREVQAANGKVTLVKIDSDEQPFLARTLRVKSLPTVFGAHKGQVVDMFIGFPGPEKVTEFVQKMVALADNNNTSTNSKE